MSPVLICTICSSLHKNNYATNSSKCWWSLAQAMLSIFKTQVTMVFDVCIQWFFLFTRSLGSTLSVNVTEVFSKYSMWPLIKYVFVYKATVAPRVFLGIPVHVWTLCLRRTERTSPWLRALSEKDFRIWSIKAGLKFTSKTDLRSFCRPYSKKRKQLHRV